MTDIESRTGLGMCVDCKYHKMEGRKHYCTDPKRSDDGHRYMNNYVPTRWHDCCILIGE